MSDLPKDWIRMPLGEVGKWFGGGTPSKANLKFWKNGNIPWVSPKDMKADVIRDAQDHITKEAVAQSSTNLAESGSVLIVARSGILQHTFPVAVAARQVALNQDLKAVKPHANINSEYLCLALRAFEREILHTCTKTGTTVQSLEFPVFQRFEIPVAPFVEQRRIVAEIEKQFTRLDAGIAALKRTQANLKRYRASILKAACEGRFSATRYLPFPVQQLGKLGKWCGGGTPSKSNPEFWESGTIPWVSPKDMKTEIVSDSEDHITASAIKQSATNLLPANAILVVTRSGILAHTLPVAVTTRPVTLNQDLKALQLTEQNNSRYIALALRAHQREILQHCTKAGTTVQSIEFPVFLRFEIPLPPLAEQTHIVAEVERRLSVVEELDAAVSANLRRAARLRQAILHQAFSGGGTI